MRLLARQVCAASLIFSYWICQVLFHLLLYLFCLLKFVAFIGCEVIFFLQSLYLFCLLFIIVMNTIIFIFFQSP